MPRMVRRGDPDGEDHERHRLMRSREHHGHMVDERQYAEPVLQSDQRQQRDVQAVRRSVRREPPHP